MKHFLRVNAINYNKCLLMFSVNSPLKEVENLMEWVPLEWWEVECQDYNVGDVAGVWGVTQPCVAAAGRHRCAPGRGSRWRNIIQSSVVLYAVRWLHRAAHICKFVRCVMRVLRNDFRCFRGVSGTKAVKGGD